MKITGWRVCSMMWIRNEMELRSVTNFPPHKCGEFEKPKKLQISFNAFYIRDWTGSHNDMWSKKIPSKLEVAPNALKMLDGVGEWMDGYPLDFYDY